MLSQYSTTERRKNLIRSAVVKWVNIQPDSVNIIHVKKHNADFYRLSFKVNEAKLDTTVSFSMHDNNELETIKTLRKELVMRGLIDE